MPITALYAALLTPLYLYLSARTITRRRARRVEIGAGDDAELLRRMRVHANFAEYVPLALLLIAFAESLSAPLWAIHGLGLMLLIGRGVHAYGLSQTPHILALRVGGMVLTLTAIGIAATLCLVLSLPRIG